VGAYVVVTYRTASRREVVAKEMRKLLTPLQMAHVVRQLGRIQEHGRQVGASYFGRIRTSNMGLEELRLTADKADIRFLFSEEPGGTLLLLTCYKEQSGAVPENKIATAEKRLKEWRARS
jgi:phage-related protein